MQSEQEARSTESLAEKEQQKEKPIAKKAKNDRFFDQVNQNYAKRSDEVEHFSKHLFNLCADLNSEFINGCLNIMQHFVEIQKKHSDRLPMWYATDQTLNWMEQNNKAWLQAVENTDTVCSDVLNNCKGIMRMYNGNYQNCVQFFERNYEFALKNTPNLED